MNFLYLKNTVVSTNVWAPPPALGTTVAEFSNQGCCSENLVQHIFKDDFLVSYSVNYANQTVTSCDVFNDRRWRHSTILLSLQQGLVDQYGGGY